MDVKWFLGLQWRVSLNMPHDADDAEELENVVLPLKAGKGDDDDADDNDNDDNDGVMTA